MKEKNKRIIMTIVGILTTGFSVGMFNLSAFGMDPFQVFSHGIWNYVPIGYGVFYTILNLIMLVFIFIIDKRKIGLGTLINIFLLGYMVEFSTLLFKTYLPNPTIALRILLLIAAVIIVSFGSSLYFIADLGVSTYDAVALILHERKVAPFKYCRIGTDLICAITGYILGATVGVGTVVTAFFMGPIIEYFNNIISIPLRYGKQES